METHGTIDANIEVGSELIAHRFQLVNKQVDIPYDGILGRDFLQRTKARNSYETGKVILLGERYAILGKVKPSEKTVMTDIKLPPRTESIVRIPVAPKAPQVGMTNKRELKEGVILAAALTRVVNGYALMSILNTTDVETEVQEPIGQLQEIETEWETINGAEFESQNREGDILSKLRLEHLNSEERKSLAGLCSDYADIFYLPGDKLSSMGAAQHVINLEAGTQPINTRPYLLPEAQKKEVNVQVQKLLHEEIIEESNSLWNSPILLLPKKADACGERKFRLVDYRKLNEKTIGNAYPLPDISEILDQLGQAKYFSCLDLAM